MKFTSQQLLSAVLLLSPAVAAQKASKSVKAGKSIAKSGAKSDKSGVTCPRDSQHAAAIGNKMWAEIWFQMVDGGCSLEGIEDVWARHLEEDITCNIQEPAFFVGVPGSGIPGPNLMACAGINESGIEGVDSCLEFFPTGTFPNCQAKNYLSFSGHSAEIDADDCMQFTVFLNEYVTTPANCGEPFAFATGRTYSFRMNEDYVEGGTEPMAKLYFVQFNCPFQLKDSLVDCGAVGIDGRIDANYQIVDETPNEPGCIAGFA